ncbi:MAG: response regulator [Deltaproteobacteria bacterium]|nr:response regulator [Deltaproteobacteria bacterium]
MWSILLVDDSRVVREVLKVYLIARDVRLVDAADGVEALAAIQVEAPDVVVTDLRMPRLDGAELCRTLHSQPRTKQLPVIILTSHLTPDVEMRCREAGAAAVLAKPIQPKRLLEEIARVLAPNAKDGACQA